MTGIIKMHERSNEFTSINEGARRREAASAGGTPNQIMNPLNAVIGEMATCF